MFLLAKRLKKMIENKLSGKDKEKEVEECHVEIEQPWDIVVRHQRTISELLAEITQLKEENAKLKTLLKGN
jgi:hypothetical protein